MDYLISDATATKLKEKHGVKEHEVLECFKNAPGLQLADTREQHKTFPQTRWFIAKTDAGRKLKVVFVPISKTECVIRTAYQPSKVEEEIYESAK